MSSNRSSLLSALSLRHIRHFVVLAHTLSFTLAAQMLALTQPALTASIRQAEFLLGQRLFVRSPQRLTLTSVGEAVLPLAERLLNQAQGTFEDIVRIINERLYTVRIAFIPSVTEWLLPLLDRLRGAQPMLHFVLLDLPNDALIDAVHNGTVDFGIGVWESDQNKDDLHHERLFEDEVIAVVRRDDVYARRKSILWESLAGRELAVPGRSWIDRWLQRIDGAGSLQWQVAYRMKYTESLYALVRTGRVTAILPSLYAVYWYEPELVALRIEQPQLTRAIALISWAGQERGLHVEMCREWLIQHYERPLCVFPA